MTTESTKWPLDVHWCSNSLGIRFIWQTTQTSPLDYIKVR